MRRSKRIGIFGGTFDPVHIGHLVAAVNARHAARLDVVLLMVANEPWQKVGTRPITPGETRFAAVQAAAAGHVGLEASRLELDRGGETYTVDTIEALAAQEPDAELVLIAGTDTARGLSTWDRWERIAELAELVVVTRPGWAPPELGPQWRATIVEIPELAISSTDLRERLADGRPLDYLIPDAAVAVLEAARENAD